MNETKKIPFWKDCIYQIGNFIQKLLQKLLETCRLQDQILIIKPSKRVSLKNILLGLQKYYLKFISTKGAGGSAGFIEICIMHPLDVVKTRFQVQSGTNPQYTSILDCFKKTIQSEGYIDLNLKSII